MGLYRVKLDVTEKYETEVEANTAEEAVEFARKYRLGCIDEFERNGEAATYTMEAVAIDAYDEYIETGEAPYDEEVFRVLVSSNCEQPEEDFF